MLSNLHDDPVMRKQQVTKAGAEGLGHWLVSKQREGGSAQMPPAFPHSRLYSKITLRRAFEGSLIIHTIY